MDTSTDIIIKTITKHLPKQEKEWELLGLINKDKEVFTFGNDSKIIGRLFEIMLYDTLFKTAEELNYELKESETQTVYPDFYFLKENGKKIAIDIKTTYRRSKVAKYGFTGGSFTSFMRNGTKNIVGNYEDYEGHYILGIVYSREPKPTIGKTDISNLNKIVPCYNNIEVFIQEKYKICGDKKGSGNTDNIGTIKANNIEPFVYGAGPFSFLGKDVFHDYWINHPRYTDDDKKKESLYTDLPSYISWLETTKGDLKYCTELREKYKKYKEFIKEKNWD